MILTDDELARYSRHLVLPEFGIEKQERIKQKKALVVGLGGLGTPVVTYLTAAGVGEVGIVDFDCVDASNLQRQTLFSTDDVGKYKVDIVKREMQRRNPTVKIRDYLAKISSENALEIIRPYDVVVDGTDNFVARYLLTDATYFLNKPLVYGSIFQWKGHVSVFNYQGGPNYRDLFPQPPLHRDAPSCSEAGVLGVLPGIIGGIQSLEALKVLAQFGEILSGYLFTFDALLLKSKILKLTRDPSNPISGDSPTVQELIDYEHFCASFQDEKTYDRTMTASVLKTWLVEKKQITLVDVRTPYEHAVKNIGGTNITSLEKILDFVERKSTPVVFYCQTGSRSSMMARAVSQQSKRDDIFTLQGGMSQW